jgi:hypothetical protein
VGDSSNENAEALQLLLGYINFSEGRPDARFQKALNEIYAQLHDAGDSQPWRTLHRQLRDRLAELRGSDNGAFKNSAQAEAVLALTFDRVLPAYHAHHADLLFHLDEADVFQPFFLARVIEAVLTQGPLGKDADHVVADALKQLNDYLGHRPIAVLENRPKGEPYPHERLRPIPLYIQGAGTAAGKYQAVLDKALEILQESDAALLEDAYFDLDLLDELALDPRAYDHGHPANRRPNYAFGEWDPHSIDGKGFYRRFVVRKLTLDAIVARTQQPHAFPAEEALFEAGAVFAGILLMSTGVSGNGPGTHDSSVTLANLVPRIAQYRDRFYKQLLPKVGGEHGERLRKEMELTKQPFGGARQHLNHFLAKHRAAQLQQRHLALLLAEMGYPDASRSYAATIPAASVRLLSEIHIRLTLGHKHIEKTRLPEAARELREIEDLLHRGIVCGAFVDPWNILGFGGLFPLFHSAEDSVRDPRIEDLLVVMDRTFNLYSRLLSETSATGDQPLADQLTTGMKALAGWWDKFATSEVKDVQRVHGGEVAQSAENVATALRLWYKEGEAVADLGFWQSHLEGFRSPKAYALVVDALLRKEDYRAAMGLLMHWLSQLDEVPLEDGDYSFHALSLRWMLGVCQITQNQEQAAMASGPRAIPDIVVKFFDYLEANAGEYWEVPRLEIMGIPLEDAEEDDLDDDEEDLDDDDDVFEAAYEGVTYKDSTDDDVESEVLEVGPQLEFDLELEGERIEKHLRFLSMVARLWTIATRMTRDYSSDKPRPPGPLQNWRKRAQENFQALLGFLDTVHEHPVPPPVGNFDSLVEFDRRRVIKDRLLHVIIATLLDYWLTVNALRGQLGETQPDLTWKAYLLQMEKVLWRQDAAAARQLVPVFLKSFEKEPLLLFESLGGSGHPKLIFRARRTQTILRALVTNLPRLGLLPETWMVVSYAQEMERRQPLGGQRVTEFDRLFQIACQASVETVIDSAREAGDVGAERIVSLLENLIQPYLSLWLEHSKTLRVAVLEKITADKTQREWNALKGFIQTYGHDLFQVKFLSLGNLRGILHQGIGAYLDYLIENADPMHPVKLIDDLGKGISREEAERHLQLILQTLIENYDIYKDYNSTAPQSDYGENLYILFDFLRLKTDYDRYAWQIRPFIFVHEVLAQNHPAAALDWQDRFAEFTEEDASRLVGRLTQLEQTYGIRLNTLADRIHERFIKPLSLDRLCALIEPAMDAAGTEKAELVFAAFEEQLKPYSENPTGVGLDLPQWLHRLEGTVHQVQMSRTALASLAENMLQIPKVIVPLDDLENQVEEWAAAEEDED